MQPESKPRRILLVAFALVSLALTAEQCKTIPPPPNVTAGAPPGPISADATVQLNPLLDTAALWQGRLRSGDYASILAQTENVLAASPDDAEAYLYRGLAELASGAQQAAQNDLAQAEQRAGLFPSSRAQQDQMLLFRGLMVVHAQLGNQALATRYFEQAMQVAPAQEGVMRGELQNQSFSFDALAP